MLNVLAQGIIANFALRWLKSSAGSFRGTIQWFGFLVFLVVFAFLRQVLLEELPFKPVDLSDRIAVITGATSGIGLETARVLAAWNATVIMPARNVDKAVFVKEQIESTLPANSIGRLHVMKCDLDSLQSVEKFAEDFSTWSSQPGGDAANDIENHGTIDMLILNAGIAGKHEGELELTKDGFDTVFQVNYLSHYLLTRLLLPHLRQAAKISGEARIVHVSSSMHFGGEILHELIESGNANNSNARRGVFAYSDSKLMQVVFSNKLHRQEMEYQTGVRSIAVHPGLVWSNIDSTGGILGHFIRMIRRFIARTTIQGAVTSVTAATLPNPRWTDFENQTNGVYLEDQCIAHECVIDDGRRVCPFCSIPAPWGGSLPHASALNSTEQDWLWNISETLVEKANINLK